MARINHTANLHACKPSAITETIQGLRIPSTLREAIAQGFKSTGHVADIKSVRGNVETLKGTATFEQGGLDWLACPVVITMKYAWSRLRATRATAEIVI